MPPELLSDGILTPATDIYSFGILLWEMVSGQSAYPKEEYSEIILEVVDGRRPIIPEDCPPSLALLMRDCWHQDYRLRPTFEEIAGRLDNILEFTMAGSEEKQESLLMQGDVGELLWQHLSLECHCLGLVLHYVGVQVFCNYIFKLWKVDHQAVCGHFPHLLVN